MPCRAPSRLYPRFRFFSRFVSQRDVRNADRIGCDSDFHDFQNGETSLRGAKKGRSKSARVPPEIPLSVVDREICKRKIILCFTLRVSEELSLGKLFLQQKRTSISYHHDTNDHVRSFPCRGGKEKKGVNKKNTFRVSPVNEISSKIEHNSKYSRTCAINERARE